MITTTDMTEKRKEGFTLLELLIVISIIAILSVALVLVLNPAETLRKSRDAQRISDLNTLKTALGLYLTSTSTIHLGANAYGPTPDAQCKTTPTSAYVAANRIFYSLPIATPIAVGETTLDGGTGGAPSFTQATTPALTDGNGWIPVNLDNLTGGSPISAYPVDPTNTIANLGNVASTDLVYRYACAQTPPTFEIDTQLESIAYTQTDNKRTSDGGNSTFYYEVGTNLKIMGATPAGVDF